MNYKCLPFICCDGLTDFCSCSLAGDLKVCHFSAIDEQVYFRYKGRENSENVCVCVCCVCVYAYLCPGVHRLNVASFITYLYLSFLFFYIYRFLSLSIYIPDYSQHLTNCSVCGTHPPQKITLLISDWQIFIKNIQCHNLQRLCS